MLMKMLKIGKDFLIYFFFVLSNFLFWRKVLNIFALVTDLFTSIFKPVSHAQLSNYLSSSK